MKYFLYFFAILAFSSANAQENIDNTWVFGYITSNPNPLFEGSIVNFDTPSPSTTSQILPFPMDIANASICDENGNLLFYTNGRYVANANHEFMENGLDLNLEYTVGSQHYMILVQGALVLPVPNHSLRYYLFHLGVVPLNLPTGLDIASNPFFYSVVDFNDASNPLGKVVEKNTEILNDTLDLGKLIATKHANGQDWWIILSERKTNKYYRFLVSPDGVENLGTQEVGDIAQEGFGQAVFSPDGTKYANVSLHGGENYIDLYDFDRCTGLLSNHQPFLFNDIVAAAGLAISSNSQFMYFIKPTEIIQFDLFADEIWESAITVAVYDGYQELVVNSFQDSAYIPTNFFLGQLGPDDKIYINSTNSVSSLTVIDKPDLEGDACDVQQHSLSLPGLNYASLPNFPNYRLGALEGSPCDTLGLVDTVEEEITKLEKAKVYPNPNNGQFFIELADYQEKNLCFSLYNTLGKKIYNQPLLNQAKQQISIENLPNGIYIYEIADKNKILAQEKMLIFKY